MGFGYYPRFLRGHELPPFADVVNCFISRRGKRDLDPAQFIEEADLEFELEPTERQIKYFREMAGLLGYDYQDGLIEICYAHPETSRIHWSQGRITAVSSALGPYDESHKARLTDVLIYYHSHPFGGPTLGSDDVEPMVLMPKHFTGGSFSFDRTPVKEYYMLIYIPLEDKTYWYKAEPTILEESSRQPGFQDP